MLIIKKNKFETSKSLWVKTIKKVYETGEIIIDQRGNEVIRMHNLIIEIPDSWILKYHIDNERMEKAFLDNLINPEPNNFDYTYGDRLHEGNQFNLIKEELRNNINSRRCVANIFNYYDIHRSVKENKEVPCGTQLHFQYFRNKLHLNLIMRSNDIVGALPSDMYGFGNLLNIICEELGLNKGSFIYQVIDGHIILDHYGDKLKQLKVIK